TLRKNSQPMKTSIAIYPGSFDPVTNGHLDLIERGEKMFDVLIVAVLQNAEKTPLFNVNERVEMLREVTKQWSGVEIDVFDGLLVDYARRRGAGVILRGIRAVSDYEYELQMALMNRKLEPRLETVFMLPGLSYSYLSSKLVREIAQFGPGEPDFPTPEHIKQAAIQAIHDNKTKYTATPGIMPLREAICGWHKRELKSNYEPKECVVNVGGKHAIFNVASVLVQAGDEVLIPAPYWVSFPDIVKYTGAP